MGDTTAIRLVRLLHANDWTYRLERCESRDWQGAPDQAWNTHTWTRGSQEIQTFTGDAYSHIDWRSDDHDSYVSTDPVMVAKLGYDGAVRLLAAVGAVDGPGLREHWTALDPDGTWTSGESRTRAEAEEIIAFRRRLGVHQQPVVAVRWESDWRVVGEEAAGV